MEVKAEAKVEVGEAEVEVGEAEVEVEVQGSSPPMMRGKSRPSAETTMALVTPQRLRLGVRVGVGVRVRVRVT